MSRREFDFSKCKQRHIALKILYFGWDFDGLAEQESSKNTIEHHLFRALEKTCLIVSREKCRFNRCGRTDKGVSSYGQVVNLDVRSNLIDEQNPHNLGLFCPEGYSGTSDIAQDKQELNYVEMLNRVLPDHIRAISWAPVDSNFSSRFNCRSRAYSYIFPLGDLDLELMQQAANYMVGEHDFRNLCSFDLKHGVVNHTRTIVSAEIRPMTNIGCQTPTSNKYSFYELIIVGKAFLYHQIRCIMTIMFLVGTKKEPPSVVRDLLDIERCPGRPNYNLASPTPLCLFSCEYDPCDLPLGWFCSTEALMNLFRQLKKLWLDYKTKSLLIERVLADIEPMICMNDPCTDKLEKNISCWKDFGLECDNMSETKYVSLLKRPKNEPLETKLNALMEKKKLKIK